MKPIVLTATAKERVRQIWSYTLERWDERQAHDYLEGLYHAMTVACSSERKHLLKRISVEGCDMVFYFRHQKHYLFFAERDAEWVVLTILHVSMDMAARLVEDLGLE